MERPDERTLSPEAKEYISYLENRLENMSAMYKNLQKEGFEFCEKLFMLEREFASLSPEERHAERKKAEPSDTGSLLDMVQQRGRPEKSPLSKAMATATGQKNILGSFLLDGQIPISNNLDENAIRPFVMGRKNWLFCNTPNGAAASAAVYSIVEMVKANGLDPYQYLKYLLERMPRSQRAVFS